MIDTRRIALDVLYNNTPFNGRIGADVESIAYVDCAADNSDSVEITINAQDEKWRGSFFPDKGATLKPRIVGRNWERPGDSRRISCGLFVLDDIGYSSAPDKLRVGGVSKPSDTDFSEQERQTIWRHTTIRRIGETIAGRYGLMFSFDCEDYFIECEEQDASDSSFYNGLCKDYGLTMKVYAQRLWVYDRERYKEKRAVRSFKPSQMKRGSFQYSTTLSGTYTGGHLEYTDGDKNIDIVCSVGGGNHTKSIGTRATSVYDASVKLCAAINNANHGNETIRFSTDGVWDVAAANCITLEGYGKLNGKYFVDKITHKYDKGSGFTSDFECSRVKTGFHHWEVGGHILLHLDEDGVADDYSDHYDTTSPAANAASTAGGAKAGQAVALSNAPLYVSSTATNVAGHLTGTYYFYDGVLVNNRYRMTVSADRCGKLPVGVNVTGWVPASYCTARGSETPAKITKPRKTQAKGRSGTGKITQEVK